MEDIGEILLSFYFLCQHIFPIAEFLSLGMFVCPVFNLTNNIEVEKTKQIMENYQRENRDVIQRNKAKLVRVCVCFWYVCAVLI